jgi:hypothetical protein
MVTEAQAIRQPAHAASYEAITVPDFQIVPVRLLPIALAVLVALIVAIESNSFWALNFFHVAGGGMWTGIDLFVGLVIGPIIGRMSVQARVDFLTRFMPKMLILMPVLVTMTLTAGWQVARYTGDLFVAYPDHWWLTASYIVVGVMSVIAVGVLEPANLAVLFELKKPRPDAQLISKLTSRFIYTAAITGVMQLATLVIMTKLATW